MNWGQTAIGGKDYEYAHAILVPDCNILFNNGFMCLLSGARQACRLIHLDECAVATRPIRNGVLRQPLRRGDFEREHMGAIDCPYGCFREELFPEDEIGFGNEIRIVAAGEDANAAHIFDREGNGLKLNNFPRYRCECR